MRKSNFIKIAAFVTAILFSLSSNRASAQLLEEFRKKTFSCGVTPELFLEHADTTNSSPGPSIIPTNSFPSSAAYQCGKFKFYYADIAVNNDLGFDDNTNGANRRATFCAVAQYIESLIDCSGVPSNNPIRVYVDTSYQNVPGHTAPYPTSFLAYASPYYTPINGIINGDIRDYIVNGTDPRPGDYHAVVKVNFDRTWADPSYWTMVYYLENLADSSNHTIANCKLDLFTVLLHEMGHAMGWFSLVKYNFNSPNMNGLTPAPVITSHNCFTGLDTSMRVGNLYPTNTLVPLINSGPSLNTSLVNNNNTWVNRFDAPHNYPVYSGAIAYDTCTSCQGNIKSYGSHLNDVIFGYTYRDRISPGDRLSPVMASAASPGMIRRRFTKGEIETFQRAMGYTLNSTYQTNNSANLANHLPYSKTMAGLNPGDYMSGLIPETITANYSVTNNNPTTVSIDLLVSTANPLQISDADGDAIRVDTTSVLNYRGCALTPNTHDALEFVAFNGVPNRVIKYHVPPNFYGRAQFGFNLYDGKERGSWVVVTIDVAKGTNVQCTPTVNMILNPSFEFGSEVKTMENQNLHHYSTFEYFLHEPKFGGFIMSDSHPYSWMSNFDDINHSPQSGINVYKEYIDCADASVLFTNSGLPGLTFPLTNFGGGPFPLYKLNTNNGGKRYQHFPPTFWNNLTGHQFSGYNLCSPLENCKKYTLEFDAYAGSYIQFSYPYNLEIAFTNQAADPLVFPTSNTIMHSGTETYAWHHVVIPFAYCGTATDLTRMLIRGVNNDAMLYIDNMVLKENNQPAVPYITYISGDSCTSYLHANVNYIGCQLQYQWQMNGVDIFQATGVNIVVPNDGAAYTVKITDACGNTATSNPYAANSSCSLCGIFSNSPNILNGTISSNINGGGPYYMNGSVTISGDVTISNATIFVKPGQILSVAANSRLTLDSTHIFGCDSMWKGIKLLVGSTTTGVLDLKHSTLIEDAANAVSIPSATGTPAYGNYIFRSQGAIFNRNRYAINISNYQNTNVGSRFLIENTIICGRNLAGYTGYPTAWPSTYALKATGNNLPFNEPDLALLNYSPVVCKDDHVLETGINLDRVGPTAWNVYYDFKIGKSGTSTDQNIFDNLRYGVYSLSSNITFENNLFNRMIYTSADGGDGIFAKSYSGDKTNNRIRVTEPNANQAVGNSFYNFFRGVEVYGHRYFTGIKSFMISDHATANTGLFGYKIHSPYYTNDTLNNNSLNNLKKGIQVLQSISNSGMYFGPLTINNNTISKVNQSGTNYWLGSAIEVMKSDQLVLGSPQVIGNVDVSGNVINEAGYGILIRAIKNTSTCMRNTVYIEDLTTAEVSYGIRHEGCNNEWTKNNEIYGFGASTSDTGAGIYTSGGSYHYILCNKIRDYVKGFEFYSPASNVRWEGNAMTNNTQSLRFTHSRIGNQQGNGWAAGNSWLKDGSFDYVGTNYQVFLKNTQGTYTTLGPLQSKLFVTNDATHRPDATTYSFPLSTSNPAYAVNFGIYISKNVGNNDCQTIVKSKGIDHNHAVIFGKYYNGEFHGTLDFIEQFDLWQGLRFGDTLVEDTTGASDEFLRMGYRGRFYKLALIDSVLNDGDTALVRSLITDTTLLTPIRDSSATGVILDDDTLANRVVSNYIKMYSIYLKYLDSTMTGDDTARVDSIANLCVLLDGNAVYMARSFWAMLDEGIKEYAENCTPSVAVISAKQTKNSGNLPGLPQFNISDNKNIGYIVTPNPNNAIFDLKQASGSIDERPVVIEIYNGLGAKVFKDTRIFIDGKTTINLGNSAIGHYIIRAITKDGTVFTSKFIIL